jgi:hypothetical protein
MSKLQCEVDTARHSVFRLLSMYDQEVAKKEELLAEIETRLRKYLKQDPTIQYSEHSDILEMIDVVLGKVKKERGVHYIAICKEDRVIGSYA